MDMRQQRGRVGARHANGKVAAGESHRIGQGQRRTGGVVDALVVVVCVRQWEKEMSLYFFIFVGETASY
jgi:hypothetical protein